MLDRKERLISSLNEIKDLLIKILTLEANEHRALDYDEYEKFYEYLQYETSIIEEIKDKMKSIVPDMVYYKKDRDVGQLIKLITKLNEKILRNNIFNQNRVKDSIIKIKKKLTSLNGYITPRSNSYIVDIRA